MEAFMGEIHAFGFNFAPKGWAQCNGQLLPINQNQALFSLLGTTYGGNGTTNFALPDLRGRVPLHPNVGGANPSGVSLAAGNTGGEEQHTLTVNETPAHTHTMQAVNASGTAASPAGQLPASAIASTGGALLNTYATGAAVPLAAASVSSTGGQPHANMQPYTVLNFCIALQGIYPSRN